jgi:hypothetical protein
MRQTHRLVGDVDKANHRLADRDLDDEGLPWLR